MKKLLALLLTLALLLSLAGTALGADVVELTIPHY